MQLKELLQDASYIGITVANQLADLSRPVTTVGMMEAPDIIDFLVPEQLLVTTGYHFYQDVASLLQLIREMDEKGCAAIGIKEKRYFDEIPTEVLELADALHFPVLLLPKDKSLSVVVKELLHDVLESHSNELIKIIHHNNEFSQLLLEEEQFVTFLDKVSDVLLKDVFILDSHIEVTHTNSNLKQKQILLGKTLQQAEDLKLFNSDKEEQIRLTFQGQTLLLLPIYATKQMTRGYFGILGLKQMTYEMTILCQQIVNLIGIANARNALKDDSQYQLLADFFTAIIEGQLDSQTIKSQLTLQHVDITTHYYCGVIEIITTKESYFVSKSTERQVSEFVRWYMAERKKGSLVFHYNDKINLLIPKEHSVTEELVSLQEFLSSKFDKKYAFMIGYSHQAMILTNLATLHKEAEEALGLVSPALHQTIVEYRPKEFRELLSLIPKSEGNNFVSKNLNSILILKNEERKKLLLQTLYLYFYHSRSINKVANDLYTHRNTILYRMKEIQKLLLVDFEDPNQRLNIMLASIIYHDQNRKY